jgi:hypothetical protein
MGEMGAVGGEIKYLRPQQPMEAAAATRDERTRLARDRRVVCR